MTRSATHSTTGRVRPRTYSDWPSALFLSSVLVNTILISICTNPWFLAPLMLLQGLLLTGCQEAKHLCAHGTFIGNRNVSDAIGTACAALVGQNFFAFRYFHLAHHPVPCTEADPEGPLYARSWRTRWIWLLAPLEVPWVAWHLTRTGWSMVPRAKRARRNAAFVWWVVFALSIAVGLRHAPRTVAVAYLIPLALSAWFDFILTQAEHYGVAIAPASCRRPQGSIANDIALPFGLGWVLLHRSLHRTHHCEPALRWFEVARRIETDPTAAPIGYIAFVRRWLTDGPRLWLTDRGSRANANVPIRAEPGRRT